MDIILMLWALFIAALLLIDIIYIHSHPASRGIFFSSLLCGANSVGLAYILAYNLTDILTHILTEPLLP